MNFNNKGLIILLVSVLLAVLMLIFAQTRIEAQTFKKGDYDTAYLRYLWFYCERGMIQRRPDVPPLYRAVFCDCLIDKIRLTLSKDELEEMQSEERQLLIRNLTRECTKQQAEEVI
tara:strand:- start:95 stop:442 length:348 start_codon:yes stop_codon:yes gene_type:complete